MTRVSLCLPSPVACMVNLSWVGSGIQTVGQWLYEAKYPVVFTGAGISTESGIPDIRGPDGLWRGRDKGLPPEPMKRSRKSIEPNSSILVVSPAADMPKEALIAGAKLVIINQD